MNMKNKIKLAVMAALIVSTQAALGNGLLGVGSPINSTAATNFSFNNGVKLYTGASAGYSGQGNACNTPFFEGECDDGSMSYKIVGGTRFNPMFGAEVAFVDQGEATLKGHVAAQNVSSNNKISGYQLNGVGYFPLAPDSVPNLELMGKAGVLFWERETTTNMGDADPTSSQDDGISPMIGLGLQYQFHQNMFLRSEWEHTFNAGSDSDFETDTDNYTMGIIYSTL